MKKIVKIKPGSIGVDQYLGEEISVLMYIRPIQDFVEDAKTIHRYSLANEGAYHVEHRYPDKRPKTFVAMGELIQEGEDYFLQRGCPGGAKQFSIPIIPKFIIGVADIGEMFYDEIEDFDLK